MSYDVDESIPLQGIQDALQRVVASRDFRNSERKRRFLKFVVQETLAGRADRIKAYSIALDAFDRDPSFNPAADPVVRIEAGRLRRCLEHYYLGEGAADRIRITIPKGGYVPQFIVMDGDGRSFLKPCVMPTSRLRDNGPKSFQQKWQPIRLLRWRALRVRPWRRHVCAF